MKGFLILSALVTVTLARPNIVQLNPLSNLQAHASASASASSSPQQLSLVQLLPNAPLGSDGRVLDTLEVRLAKAEHEAAHRKIQANLANVEAQEALEQSLKSASSTSSTVSSAAPLAADGRVVDTLEVSLVKAAHAAAHRNEQLRLQAAKARAQAQQQSGASSLLSATRLAQSLASLSPVGASSSSSVQLVESPEVSAVQAQQAAANLQQNLLLARQSSNPLVQANGLPLVVGSDGQLVATPLLLW